MSHLLAELLGTMLLIILGDGVVANVLLKKTNGNGGGGTGGALIAITTGWAFAVAIPVYIFGGISGAHFNPAVTLAAAVVGKFPWAQVPGYIAAQMVGAFLGACVVYLHYLPHWAETEDKGAKLGVFCTGPAIKNTPANFMSEFIGTFILVFIFTGLGLSKMVDGIGPFVVGLVIWVIGLALGGTTGYAINPARDLGPRIAHFVLPIAGKGGSNWGYSWIPVVAPICGGICAALVWTVLL